MLFYNHDQEFIGIDEDGLKLLNFKSLEELLKVCSDVADLFLEKPGCIHKFKNFGWIDFLLHADSTSSSAIVNANGRVFSCMLQVQKLFLCAEPSQNGYMIKMVHAVPISAEEIPLGAPENTLKTAQAPRPLEEEETPSPAAEAPSVLPDYSHLTPTPLSEPGTLDIPPYGEPEPETLLAPEEPLSPLVQESLQSTPQPPRHQPPASANETIRFTPEEAVYIANLKVDPSYRFDPSIAANELGLPVDLIQEFIGDFIQQSHDFKDDLFDAVLKGDMNNLKILSHKLKGVAANLRIEDAYECLSVINVSSDYIEIEANLKYFYGIIAKLEGKKPYAPSNRPPLPEEESEPSAAAELNPLPPEAPESGGESEAFPPFLDTPETAPEPDNAPETAAAVFADDDIYAFSPKTHAPEVRTEPSLPAASAASLPDTVRDEPLSLPEEILPAHEEPLAPNAPLAEEEALHLSYDRETVARELGIERSFFDELIDDYKHEADQAGRQVMEAIGAFDTRQWQQTASQLKGISDNLRLGDISDELAILSRTNDAQEAHKAAKRLVRYLEQL